MFVNNKKNLENLQKFKQILYKYKNNFKGFEMKIFSFKDSENHWIVKHLFLKLLKDYETTENHKDKINYKLVQVVKPINQLESILNDIILNNKLTVYNAIFRLENDKTDFTEANSDKTFGISSPFYKLIKYGANTPLPDNVRKEIIKNVNDNMYLVYNYIYKNFKFNLESDSLPINSDFAVFIIPKS